jgi:plastocyanin
MPPLIACCLILAAVQPPPVGTIAGTIRYVGDVPPSRRIMTVDGVTFVHNDVVVQAKTKGLRDVIVLLDWKENVLADAKAKPIVIDQRDMLFSPRVVTVQEGRKVRFENNDTCNHAVDAQSVHRENVFNVTTPMGQPFEFKFKAQKNPIPIGCAIHPWMRSWILVAAHPYHAVTDADGKFQIERVPAGKHAILLIHPDTNYRESVQVEVQAGKTAEMKLDWKVLKKP